MHENASDGWDSRGCEERVKMAFLILGSLSERSERGSWRSQAWVAMRVDCRKGRPGKISAAPGERFRVIDGRPRRERGQRLAQNAPWRPGDGRKPPSPSSSSRKRAPESPVRATISRANGRRATRNRGRSGGIGRRARGRRQARRAFPAGMESLDPLHNVNGSGSGARTGSGERLFRNRRIPRPPVGRSL